MKEFVMKRMLIFLAIVSLMFSFLFTGCEEDSKKGLTDDEVSKIAMSSLGSGALTLMIIMAGLSDDVYGPGETGGDLGGQIVSGTLTVATVDPTTTNYTFTACELDMDEPLDGDGDVTLGGAFSVTIGATSATITLTDFNIIGVMPGTTSVLNVIVNGTHTVTTTAWNANLTVSGITAQACTVVIVMTAVGGEPEEITSATINGVDYTDQFIAALNEM
jgi:hypothetical protein